MRVRMRLELLKSSRVCKLKAEQNLDTDHIRPSPGATRTCGCDPHQAQVEFGRFWVFVAVIKLQKLQLHIFVSFLFRLSLNLLHFLHIYNEHLENDSTMSFEQKQSKIYLKLKILTKKIMDKIISKIDFFSHLWTSLQPKCHAKKLSTSTITKMYYHT